MSCPHCFSGGIHDHATPQGKMETLYGFSCYVASPPAGSTSKSEIVFLCDAFGLKLINNKLLADRYAADTGMKVIVPDVLPGGGVDVYGLDLLDTVTKPVGWIDIMGQLRRAWAVVNAMYLVVPFMMKANVNKFYPSILNFVRAVRKDMHPGGKLGVCGFCWGAFASTKLCTESATDGDGSVRLIDAQYNAHPSQLKTPDMILDAITKYKVPYSVAVGDVDMAWGVKSVHETQAALREKVGVPETNDYEIRIYPGCHHGFAARAKKEDKVEIEGCEEAAKQAIVWWNKYLN